MDQTNAYDIFAFSEGGNGSSDILENTRVIDMKRHAEHRQRATQTNSGRNVANNHNTETQTSQKKKLFSRKKNNRKKAKNTTQPIREKKVTKRNSDNINRNSKAALSQSFSHAAHPSNVTKSKNVAYTSNGSYAADSYSIVDGSQGGRKSDISNYIDRSAPGSFTNMNRSQSQASQIYSSPRNISKNNRSTSFPPNAVKKGKKEKNRIKKSRKKASNDIVYENLRQQNPRVRRARRFQKNYLNGKGIPSSPALRAQRYRIKVKRKALLSLLFGRFVIFLTFYMLLAFISCSVFYINLKRPPEADTEPYLLIINDKTEDKKSYELKVDDFYINGGLYLDMSMLANTFDLTTTGDIENLRYVNTSNGDELRVTVGSSIVTMNTVSVPLGRPVVRHDSRILIPIEFFGNYVEGITIKTEKDEKTGVKKIYLDQTVDGYTSSVLYGNKATYAPISFALKDPSAASNIPENSLPTDILYETDPIRLAEEAVKAAEEARKAEEAAAAAAAGNTVVG